MTTSSKAPSTIGPHSGKVGTSLLSVPPVPPPPPDVTSVVTAALLFALAGSGRSDDTTAVYVIAPVCEGTTLHWRLVKVPDASEAIVQATLALESVHPGLADWNCTPAGSTSDSLMFVAVCGPLLPMVAT